MPCDAPVTMAVLLPVMLNSCFYLQEWGMPQINLASNVIAALRAFETGQFFSASFAISAQSAEKCSCVGRDASKLRTQTWCGEVYERAHLRYRHAAGRRKQMYRERRMFSIGQDDF
jgi:hypothetical protein